MMKIDPGCLTPLDPISSWAVTVNWEPWVAVGTIGAVIVALVVADQGRRERNERDRAKVRVVLTMARGLRDIYRGSVESDDSEIRLRSPAQLGTFQDLRALFESVNILELPSRGTVDAYMTVAAFLQMSARLSQMTADGTASPEVFRRHCERTIGGLDNCIAQLVGESLIVGRPKWSRVMNRGGAKLMSAIKKVRLHRRS